MSSLTDHTKRRRPFRRTRKILGVVAATALGTTLASTGANAFLEQQERWGTAQYGELVEVAGGSLNVVRAGTEGGQPLVLLSGLGTIAPALDFAPLIRELVAYDVIVVERFGYGYSDMGARDRTVENTSTELHEALSSLDIGKPYVLAGHSIAGFYTLDYANRYPGEVAAVPHRAHHGVGEAIRGWRHQYRRDTVRHWPGPDSRLNCSRIGRPDRRRLHQNRIGTHAPNDNLEFRQRGSRRRKRPGCQQRCSTPRNDLSAEHTRPSLPCQ
ncbi:alpha/beta fold hydrolase [Pseudarthrobacter sp. NPDC092184]|uniref:alpha/beta fold hydrolase n=1 Tax=unclassified Pseudarthrobacter TaxID=2647000 RepID=UPI00380F63BE